MWPSSVGAGGGVRLLRWSRGDGRFDQEDTTFYNHITRHSTGVFKLPLDSDSEQSPPHIYASESLSIYLHKPKPSGFVDSRTSPIPKAARDWTMF